MFVRARGLSVAVMWHPLRLASLGLPGEDREKFFDWAIGMTSDGDMLGSSAAVAQDTAPLIAERRANPTDDLISVLVEARIEDTDAHAMDEEPTTNRTGVTRDHVRYSPNMVCAVADMDQPIEGSHFALALSRESQRRHGGWRAGEIRRSRERKNSAISKRVTVPSMRWPNPATLPPMLASY